MQHRTIPAGRRLGATALLSLALAAPLAALGGCAVAESSIRPVTRVSVDASARPMVAPPAVVVAEATPEFQAFVEGVWSEARGRGVSRPTFDTAFRGVVPDPKIVALTRKQSEFSRPLWDYVNGAVSGARLTRGAEAAARWSSTLDAIERTHGVPRAVVLGVWGMETNYGSFTGEMDVIRSLATLAYTGYRGEFFRGELLTALQILERDRVARESLKGSWAGAMGQTQFMPTSYVKYAVDGDGDGRRDIWTSVPDALASTANFLKEHGWQAGLPWGYEVVLPAGFDLRTQRAELGAWARLGVRRADGRPINGSGEATLFLPGGAGGPAFLVTANFDVIKSYNSSDAYALGVAHLGDRVLGGGPIRGTWPTEPMLDRDQRQELQQRLSGLGLYVGDADGKLGSKTREAVRQFQLQRGLTPDGYANLAVLNQLRQTR